MSETAVPARPAPSRARQTRDEATTEVRQRRRRMGEDDEGAYFNFWVDESKLDRANYAYRFVNDTKNRIQRLYEQDWDIVSEAEAGFSVDRATNLSSGAKGDELRAVLMRKPIDYFNEDQAAKQRRIDEQMKRAARGDELLQERGASGENLGGLSAANAYRPHGTNAL